MALLAGRQWPQLESFGEEIFALEVGAVHYYHIWTYSTLDSTPIFALEVGAVHCQPQPHGHSALFNPNPTQVRVVHGTSATPTAHRPIPSNRDTGNAGMVVQVGGGSGVVKGRSEASKSLLPYMDI